MVNTGYLFKFGFIKKIIIELIRLREEFFVFVFKTKRPGGGMGLDKETRWKY